MKFNIKNIKNKTKLCDGSLLSAYNSYSGPVPHSTDGESVTVCRCAVEDVVPEGSGSGSHKTI